LGGFLGIPEVFANNAHLLHNFLSPIFEKSALVMKSTDFNKSTELTLMAISVLVALSGVIFAWNKFSKRPEIDEPTGFGKVLSNKWYVDELYDAIIEKSIVDGVVNGIGKTVQYGSRQLRLLQSGQVGAYVLMMVIGIIILFVIEIVLKK